MYACDRHGENCVLFVVQILYCSTNIIHKIWTTTTAVFGLFDYYNYIYWMFVLNIFESKYLYLVCHLMVKRCREIDCNIRNEAYMKASETGLYMYIY